MATNILRVRRTKGFTVVPDKALRDEQLSFRARGILAYLLSMPDGWEHGGARGLADTSPTEGRDALLTALQELEDAGYLSRPSRQGEHGQWSTVWTVSDQPDPAEPNPADPDLSLSTETGKPRGAQPRAARHDRTRRRTQIPDDWEPSDTDLAWANQHYPHLDPWAIAREFRTYHQAKGTTFARWDMAYRNRIQQVDQRRTPTTGPTRTFL